MGSEDGAERPPAAGGMAARLRAARTRSFVGRRAELELFRSALDQSPPPFAVLHVHGPAGIGKTALLGRFADEARAAGRPVVVVDGRAIEASPVGVRQALASRLGVGPEGAVAALAAEPAPVLVVDTYALISSIDDWFRSTLVPQLPRDSLVVVGSRHRPGPGWRSDPGWDELLRVVALRDLHGDDARRLLDARGVGPSRHDDALALAHGHPLALVLVSDVLRDHHGDGPFSLDDARDAVVALLQRYLGHVPDEAHRQALYVTAHTGFATESLLRATTEGAPADVLFDWLGTLSFTESLTSGVALHELVGDLLDHDLRWRDPDGYLDLHHRVLEHLIDRPLRTTGPERDQAMLDLLLMHRHSGITGSFFGQGRGEWWIEPARSADHDPILAMAHRHEGDAAAAIAQYWLGRQPEAFAVLRRGAGDRVLGFVVHLQLGDRPGGEVEVDPVAAAVWEHVRACAPLRPGECVRVMRFWVVDDGHQVLGTFPLVSTRATVDYTVTDGLAWAFGAIRDADAYDPMFELSGFHRVPQPDVVVGDLALGLFARDMRTTSMTDWWWMVGERIVSRAADPDQLPQPEQRRLLVLAHDDFREAVRDALRRFAEPAGLQDNPLVRSRVVVEHASGGPPDEALRDLLVQAVGELADDPRDDRPYRVLYRTYLRPAPTQQAAASVVGLPFSTFRRHLAKGVDHVTSWLWERELHGRPDPASG